MLVCFWGGSLFKGKVIGVSVIVFLTHVFGLLFA